MNRTENNKILGIDLTHRKFGLDLLRALAIIFVLLIHTDFSFLPVVVCNLLKIVMFDGVGIFFVLSGFLIGNILIKTIDKDGFSVKVLLKFWVNRWMRTLPPYYFVLLLLLIVSRSFVLPVQSYFLSFIQKMHYFFFLQNFSSPHFGFFPESWSLAVEEWFYLLTPIVLFAFYSLLNINIKKAFIYTIVLFLIGAFLNRFYDYHIVYSQNIDDHLFNKAFYTIVLSRLDAIMFGVIGAYVSYFHHKIWVNHIKVFFLIGLFLLLFNQFIVLLERFDFVPFSGWIGIYLTCFSFPLFSLGILLLLPYLDGLKLKNKGKIFKTMTFISLISYSFYLLHFTLVSGCIMYYLEGILELDRFSYLVVYWSISILLSVLMFKYIERPSMNLRKKIKF